MSRYIPEAVRAEVARRADYRCEYCRRPEADSFIRYQIDHILSLKHGGASTIENLALSCPICNARKGTDLGTVLQDEETLVRLFHPRKDAWFDHFEVIKGIIHPKTPTGEATIKLLELNDVNRIIERLDLITAGLFP